MKVYLGADHGGFALKETLKKYLGELGYELEDLGAHELNPDDDYPDFVIPVALRVAQGKLRGEGAMGIILGRSGNGEAIAANKVKGIRATVCLSEKMAQKAREDNDANVLSLGSDFVDEQTARNTVKTFLETPFSNEMRHKRRIDAIKSYEAAHSV